MLKSKSNIVKFGGYFLIGFFSLIIIVSFGMPDFMSRMGGHGNAVAAVNGETITRIDYIRIRDRVFGEKKNQVTPEIERMLLDRMIQDRLRLQLAMHLDVKVSDELAKKALKRMFSDDKGNFNEVFFKQYLDSTMMTVNLFFDETKKQLLQMELAKLFNMGIGVSPEMIDFENLVSNSAIQIKYAFLSDDEIKAKYKDRLVVTDAEVDAELKKNPSEAKDPKSDKNRLKLKIEGRKFDLVKKELVSKVNDLASKNGTFANASAVLGGKINTSNVFKVGENVTVGKDEVLYAVTDSDIFRAECLALKDGETSRAIEAYNGIYLFTPVKRELKKAELKDEDKAKLEEALLEKRAGAAEFAYVMPFSQKAKIEKYTDFSNRNQ